MPQATHTHKPILTFSRCLNDRESFPPFSAPFSFLARPFFSASTCLCLLIAESEDHNAESSVTMFGRDICGGINPLEGPPSPLPAAAFSPAKGPLLFLEPLPLPPPLSLCLRLGVVSGVSAEATGADMNDAELASTESNRSAADGRDIFINFECGTFSRHTGNGHGQQGWTMGGVRGGSRNVCCLVKAGGAVLLLLLTAEQAMSHKVGPRSQVSSVKHASCELRERGCFSWTVSCSCKLIL